MDSKQAVYDSVRQHYSSAAKVVDDNSNGNSNSNSNERYGRKVAAAFGYSEDELAAVPADANLGLSCGNPLALAKLKEVCLYIPMY